MTARANGKNVCDGCGKDVDNAGIDKCAFLSDLEPDAPGGMTVRHYCRGTEDKPGCRDRILELFAKKPVKKTAARRR